MKDKTKRALALIIELFEELENTTSKEEERTLAEKYAIKFAELT